VTRNLGYIPSRVIAGETIWIAAANTLQSSQDIILADFTPADGYTLAYQFAGAVPATVTAAANGGATGWTLDVTAATTLTWRGGPLNFAAYVTHTTSGRKFAVDAGTVSVTASPLATSAWTAIVAACDAAILAGATSGQVSWGVDGMNASFKSTAELISLRDYARMMERQETGNHQPRIMRTRFT
jgi:hypothetical protein